MSQAVVAVNAGVLLPVLAPAIGAAVVLVVDVAAQRLRRTHYMIALVSLVVGAVGTFAGLGMVAGGVRQTLCLPGGGQCMDAADAVAPALQLAARLARRHGFGAIHALAPAGQAQCLANTSGNHAETGERAHRSDDEADQRDHVVRATQPLGRDVDDQHNGSSDGWCQHREEHPGVHGDNGLAHRDTSEVMTETSLLVVFSTIPGATPRTRTVATRTASTDHSPP